MKDGIILDKESKENEGKTDQTSPKENLTPKENQELLTKDNKIRKSNSNIYISKILIRNINNVYMVINNNKRRNNIVIKKEKRKKINTKVNRVEYRNKILYILLLNLIFQIEFNNDFHNNYLLNVNEITLKVKGTGIQNILFDLAINNYDHIPCPSKRYVDDVVQNRNPCYQVNVNKLGSIIKLEWDKPLNSTYALFRECENITEINLTNFDTSLVIDMSNMFSYCHSLISIDVSNLNTAKVNKMKSMFQYCNLLTSLNLMVSILHQLKI